LCIPFAHPLRHLGQRSAGKENLVHASALHDALIVMRDRSAAAPENFDVVGAVFFQLPDDFSEEVDVSAVIAGNSNRAHIFLNGSAHDIFYIAMKTEINDLDAMADKLEVDGVDRAIVPIANRN